MALTIGVLAGEASGDNLGAPLLRELARRDRQIRFCGVGGPGMIAAGLESRFDIERLSVNGFIDPLTRLPELLDILRKTRDQMIEEQVDCFIGVDFNFFNLLLEGMLRKRGIKTVHYVSPTVWAWRKGRIRRIVRNVDLMLTLYPFETDIYESNGVAVKFVGHPKADEIDPRQGERGKAGARARLGYGNEETVIAVLPGSRGSEVKYSGPDFLGALGILAKKHPGIRFVVPAANDKRKEQVESLIAELCPDVGIEVIDGEALVAMTAADAVLVNSGTATLEAMLLKRPMVMSYRLGKMTYAIVSRLVTTPWFALPNVLAGRALVPELIQDDATPDALAAALDALLSRPDNRDLLAAFDDIHGNLRCNAAGEAADAVLELCR